MVRINDLYFDQMVDRADELMDEGVSEEEAYAQATEDAYYALGDSLADRADRIRQEEKDSR